MRRALFRSIMPLGLLLLAACNPMAELEDADAAVAQFHTRFNQSDFASIWRTSSADFRGGQPQEEFDGVFEALRERLGAETATNRDSFSLNTNNGVTTVSMTHTTIFEHGEGAEDFVFVREGESLRLLNYNVKSPALIGN